MSLRVLRGKGSSNTGRVAYTHAQSVEVEGVPVRVFTAEHLAAIVLQTGQAKDKIRLTQFLEWDGFDRTGFDQIVSRYPGLLVK